MGEIKFFIKVPDKMVRDLLGIFTELNYFGQILLLYSYDGKRVKQLGAMPWDPSTEKVLKMYGFKDFTEYFRQLYPPNKPEKVLLFEIDLEEVGKYIPEVIKILRKLK